MERAGDRAGSRRQAPRTQRLPAHPIMTDLPDTGTQRDDLRSATWSSAAIRPVAPGIPALRSLTLARPGRERAGARDAQAGRAANLPRSRQIKRPGAIPLDQLIDRLVPRPCFRRRRWIHSGPPTGLVCPCDHGEVAEWSIAPHSKCGIRATVSGVRIPPSPPYAHYKLLKDARLTRGWRIQASDIYRPKDRPDGRPDNAFRKTDRACPESGAPVRSIVSHDSNGHQSGASVQAKSKDHRT